MTASTRRRAILVSVCLSIAVVGSAFALYWLPNGIYGNLNGTAFVTNDARTWKMQASLRRHGFDGIVRVEPVEIMPVRTFAPCESVVITTAYGLTLAGQVITTHEEIPSQKLEDIMSGKQESRVWLDIRLTPAPAKRFQDFLSPSSPSSSLPPLKPKK